MTKLEIWQEQPKIVQSALKEKKCGNECLCRSSKVPSQVFCDRYWRMYVPKAAAIEAQLDE